MLYDAKFLMLPAFRFLQANALRGHRMQGSELIDELARDKQSCGPSHSRVRLSHGPRRPEPYTGETGLQKPSHRRLDWSCRPFARVVQSTSKTTPQAGFGRDPQWRTV